MAPSTRSDITDARTRATGLPARALRRLLSTGAITNEQVITHGVTCFDVSQSNSVALIEVGDGTRLAVKDMSERASGDQGSGAAEVALYAAAAAQPALARLLPRSLPEHSSESMLVLEGLATSRRFDHALAERDHDHDRLGALLGESLGSWHRNARDLAAPADARPWMLRLLSSDRLPVLDEDPTLRSLTRRIGDDESLSTLLARLSEEWDTSTVIHGDVRFANVMVCRSPLSLRFIDWETCCRGDPYWDIAGPVQEFLTIGIQQHRAIDDTWQSQPVEVYLAAYEDAIEHSIDRTRLAVFVAGRLVMRAIQLTNWTPGASSDDTADLVERHLEAARNVASHATPSDVEPD